MNLRLEENRIRFRISREELDSLLENKIISGSTMAIQYCIKLDGNTLPATLGYSNDKFIFTLSPQVVIEHRKALPSKEGIVEKIHLNNGNVVFVSLEVDVRSRSNKGAKK